jgi:hypothetical protein
MCGAARRRRRRWRKGTAAEGAVATATVLSNTTLCICIHCALGYSSVSHACEFQRCTTTQHSSGGSTSTPPHALLWAVQALLPLRLSCQIAASALHTFRCPPCRQSAWEQALPQYQTALQAAHFKLPPPCPAPGPPPISMRAQPRNAQLRVAAACARSSGLGAWRRPPWHAARWAVHCRRVCPSTACSSHDLA